VKLREILDLLRVIASDNHISTPMICGGVARSKAMDLLNRDKKPMDISDLDVTTGDAGVHSLAKLFVTELSKKYEVSSKSMDDGHTSVFIGDFKVDFSSNYIVPNIDKILADRGIKNPSVLQKEMFSRDFTCNSLLLSLDMKKLKDPLKVGINDIKNKIIKTCLDPHTTFTSNTNRIIRVVYLSAKLGFDVDEEIISWITQHRSLVSLSSNQYLSSNLNKAFKYNQERTIEILNKTNLWTVIPVTDQLLPFYKQREKIAQLFTNYDYTECPSGPSTGPYNNIDKYKSISNFRKKRRMKTIKKLLSTRR
jgi:Poly A polymerase head domain